MSTKTKLTSLIITFILLASLLIVGVFAATQANFNVGGSITFNTKGIDAEISLVGVEGLTYNEGKLTTITLNDDMSKNDVQEAFSAWTGLELAFNEGVSTATITLKIENLSDDAQNFIGVSLSSDNGTAENCNVSVKVDDDTYASCIASGEDDTFVITFKVEDPRYKASLTDFVVDFDMEKVQERSSYSEIITFTDIADTTNEVSVKAANYDLTDDIKIPAYVKTGTTVYEVTKIEDNAFGDGNTDEVAVSSKFISIPSTVTRIGESAFCNCASLTSITIPDSVTSIDGWAFYHSGIESIEIPSSVTSMGDGTFGGCAFTNVIIPSSVTSIGEQAFSGCEDLISIEIPSSVTSIGEQAFCYCVSLESVTIPSSVTSIGSDAFGNCTSLTSITIPSSVTSIGRRAFADSGLTTINFAGSEAQWTALVGTTDIGVPEDCVINYNVVY